MKNDMLTEKLNIYRNKYESLLLEYNANFKIIEQ